MSEISTEPNTAVEAPGAPNAPRHWAADDPSITAAEVMTRARTYFDTLRNKGLLDLYASAHKAFYGLSETGEHETSRVITFGDQGEKLGVRSNQFRSLVKFVYLSATADRPTIKPRAINNSPDALAQIPTARKVLDYYDRAQKMQKHLNGAALRALLCGTGYVWQSWDPSLGPAGEDGRPQGDLLCRACSPTDVVRDLDNDSEPDWFAIRQPRNRFDLAAVWASAEGEEELRDKILGGVTGSGGPANDESSVFAPASAKDYVDEYHFMHRRTPSVPEGRYMILLPDETVLFSGGLPYDKIPVDAMCPEEFLGLGPVGYASAWDLLALQETYDSVLSVSVTNHDAYGHNDMLIPDGAELGYEEIRDGLNALRFPPGEGNKPVMLEKFSIGDAAFRLKDWVKGDMELALGVNSVARGEPEASLESGAALALVQAQAIQAQSPFVSAFNSLIEDVATTRIRILKQHLSQDRVVSIAGDDDPDSVSAFSVKDISQIDRIECESVNPLFRTIAGRQNAADKMLERGQLKSAPAYVHFMETGRLELTTDDDRQADLFGRRVREMLMQAPPVEEKPGPDGVPVRFVPALRYIFIDDPRICIAAVKHVLSSLEARSSPGIQAAALAYAGEVFRVWRASDPASLALMGYPTPPPPDVAPAAPQRPTKPPPAGRPTPEKVPDDAPPPRGSSMPNLPKPAKPPPLPEQ